MSTFNHGQHYPIDLNDLPHGWVIGAVGDFIDDVRPGFPSGAHNQTGEGIAHLRPMNVNRAGQVDLSVLKFVPDKDGQRVQPGDVLFNNTNSPELVGKTAVIPPGVIAAYSNHMTRLRPPDEIDPRFLAVQLHYLWMTGYFLHRCVNHVNQASISSKTLSDSVPLLVPPLTEQRRIVAEIETQFTRLDAAVAALERVQASLKRYRAAVLADAVQGNLTNSWSLGSKECASVENPDVPFPIPPDWSWRVTKDVCISIENGNTPPADEMHAEGEIPFLKVYNLTRFGKIDFSVKPTFISRAVHEGKLRRSIIRPGDVLMNIVGPPLGKVGLVTDAFPEWNTNQAVVIFRPTSELMAEYLCFALLAEPVLQPIVKQARATAGQFNISLTMCRNALIPVPPVDEQERIANEIQRRISVIDNIETTIHSNMRRAERLRQSILRQAFAGQLVPQDPDDEPASLLLERIRDDRSATVLSKKDKPRGQSRTHRSLESQGVLL